MNVIRLVPFVLLAGAMAAGCTENDAPGESTDAEGQPATGTEGRQQIRVVGSSTVYPFSSYVAEEFGATTEHPTPVIESTGSGGGIKLFCSGDGLDTPDITNASRRIEPDELERCHGNGVERVTEAAIGYDGIVVAEARTGERLDLTLEQITLAVAEQVPQGGELVPNPYQRWNEIDDALPDREILIYGPPTTSGTRDSFEELVMEAATAEMDGYGGEYTSIRQDGQFVPSGENDNLIVQKIEQNREAIGVFGYGFLEENTDRIQPISVAGVEPTPEAISGGEYPISRSMFFYTKNSHFGRVSGMDAYAELFMSEQMIAPEGYLADLGLIPLPEDMRERARERVSQREPVEVSELRDES